MANAPYKYALQRGLVGGINIASGTIKAALVRTGGGHYVVNLTTDQHVSAISSGDIIARSSAMTSKTTTSGTFDADDVTWTAVAAGPAAGAIVIYEDLGSDAASLLIEYRDADTGMPVTPTGGDITVIWDSGANRIFTI